MKTTIYYFSGTGNSLAIAREIASKLTDTYLIPIASFRNDTTITAPAGRVGFVFPVYFFSAPRIVAEFLKKLDVSDTSYFFAVVTMGGMQGQTLALVNSLLKKKNKRLDAGWSIAMPGNYVAMYDVADAEKQKNIIDKAGKKIPAIIHAIQNNNLHPVRGGPGPWIAGCISRHFTKNLSNLDTNFTTDDTCTGCGICARVCPVDNITIEESRPVWHHQCETCFACIHLCPEQAIQYGTKSRRFGRYHHPDVTIRDISRERGTFDPVSPDTEGFF